jgi:hypothetical protein
LSLFDNGNLRRSADPNANSRGQVFRINEVGRVADLVLNADLGFYSFALGSAQLLDNGDYHFANGFLQDGTGISEEVDASGNIVSSIHSSAPDYRTFRMKSLYTE